LLRCRDLERGTAPGIDAIALDRRLRRSGQGRGERE